MSPDTGLNPVISQLRDHLAFRRMECGMSALAAHSAALHALDPAEPNAGMARACIWQGLTLAAEPDADLEAARRSCQQAMALLQPEGVEGQRGWDDLETLKNRVLQTRPIDPLLRAWSNGAVENETFQQMTEEFARIVIPKVWEREDRKVARVAKKLSISPKKVRRILHSAGVSERQHV